MNKCVVYWIRHPDHTNVFSQGYVGISVDHDIRWYNHKYQIEHKQHKNPHLASAVLLHGWDNLVKEVVLIADKDYCYNVENFLRPTANIGWNVNPGGGENPMDDPEVRARHKNKVQTVEYRKKQREITLKRMSEGFVPPKMMGENHPRFNKICPEISERQTGGKNHMAKKVKYAGSVFGSMTELAKHLRINYNTLKWHVYNKTNKYNVEYV